MSNYKNFYAIQTINSVEKRNRRNLTLMAVLISAFLCILIFLLIKVSNNIKIIKNSKEYEKQVIDFSKNLEKSNEIKKQEEENKRLARLPKLTEQGKENFRTIFHSGKKRAFLTFDDGPSSVTNKILNTLDEKGVKATFFVLGINAEKNKELVKNIYEKGHYIGNHGYSHIYSQIYSTPQNVIDEYNKTNDIIKEAINEPEFNSHLFRFPGGFYGGKYANIKKEAGEILKQNDILNIDWNCLTGDSETTSPTPEYVMKRLEETSNGKNSLVILMHDASAKKITAEMLPQIIDYLAEHGYEFTTFYDIFK